MLPTSAQPCRLCNGPTELKFQKEVLKRYSVGYYECTECGSLQTEPPYWLDESYRDSRRFFDIRAASRAQRLQMALYLFRRAVGLSADALWLDWGAGDGLLVRLLRDVGVRAYHYDLYAENRYAVGFEADMQKKFSVITAFEVWEHLPDPASELDKIFSLHPDFHIASTAIYRDQDETWKYLYAQTGRHVFFYSASAVQKVAEKYGYHAFIANDSMLVFHRQSVSSLKVRHLRWIFGGTLTRLRSAYFALLKKPSLVLDDQRTVMQLAEQGELPVDGCGR